MRRDQLEHAIRTACHLCVAKLCAFREKDQNFVAALLDVDLVNAEVIAKRLPEVPKKRHSSAERALSWLAARG